MKVIRIKKKALLGQVSDMDLRLLRVFKAVVQCGGMAPAELELNIGISTISRHVKDLEERLGLVLCRRGRGGFALTVDGQIVYQDTLRLLSSVEDFRSRIDGLHDRMTGELHVAVFEKTVTNPSARISKAISYFSDLAPDVTLNFHIEAINEIERGVMDGSYHVGIIPAHRNSVSLTYTDLFGEQMLLYCGTQHPIYSRSHNKLTWTALKTYAFAGLGFHSPNMELTLRAGLSRSATADEQEAIATLILSGRYLGFLPDHYAESFVRNDLMQAILPKQFRYSCRFVSMLRKSPTPSRAGLLFQSCLSKAHSEDEII